MEVFIYCPLNDNNKGKRDFPHGWVVLQLLF